MARITTLIYCLIPIWGWSFDTLLCAAKPLKLLHYGMELSLRSITVKDGQRLELTCDGSAVGHQNPYLLWYGNDGYRIAHEGKHNRVYVERSTSMMGKGYSRYQKLVLTHVRPGDAGVYTCRGWGGQDAGYLLKSVRIIVEQTTTTQAPPTTTTTQAPPTTTTTPTTTSPHTTTTGQPIETNSCPAFRCNDGPDALCLDTANVCDGFPDCPSGEDEDRSICGGLTCSEGSVACADHSVCVLESELCDGKQQCTDGSDERHVTCDQ